MQLKIDLIAGARPNFMKIAPIIDQIKEAQKEGKSISFRLVHTGQHFDRNMSGNFFEQLGIPCMALCDNTERPETITIGTNELIGTNPKAIKPALEQLFSGHWKKGNIPELWDGHTAARIVKIILEIFS